MSPLQTALYFREWGKVREHFRAKGIDPKLCDAKRHELHKKALGKMKSSKEFTNSDLDKVLATFRAISEPGNLTAQLRQIDQPEQRRQDCYHKAMEILSALKIGDRYAYDDADLESRRLAYLDGLVAKIIKGKRWELLDDKQANVVLGVLQRRLIAWQAAEAKHETPAPAPMKKTAKGNDVPW